MPQLIREEMEACVMIEKRRTPDGQGGTTTQYVESAPFQAAITKYQTLDALRAEKEGVTELYAVTTDKGMGLDYGDTFKRVSDGLKFRVKSNAKDSETLRAATFAFERVRAERWEQPA